MTIVAADDDASIRQLLAAILTRVGYQVFLAEDGSQAVAMVHEHEPDLVILDFHMPGLDGPGVAKVLRAGESTADIPLLLLSAVDDDNPELENAEAIWNGRVRKPFTPSALKAEIARLVSAEERGVDSVADDGKPVWEGVARPMRRNYLGSLKSAVEEMQQALRSAADAEQAGPALRTMRRRFHQIHGSAASYGFPGIGQVAAEAEVLLDDWLAQPVDSETTETYLDRVAKAVTRIDGLLAGAVQLRSAAEAEKAVAEDAAAASAAILALHDDAAAVAAIARAASTRPWRIESFESPEAAISRLREAKFDLVSLAGKIALDPELRGVAEFAAEAGDAAVVLSGGSGATAHRLAAVEAGVHLYVDGDCPAVRVVSDWASLLAPELGGKGRVMIVDDDAAITQFEVGELRGAGCEVLALDDAVDVFAHLEQYEPDLLVMDVDMPSANGLDVAKALRASERWARLPLIIQTVHSSPEFRLRAFESGADDFLNKPILEEELRIRVLGRLERERLKSELADRDPATGLHNRKSFIRETTRLVTGSGSAALATVIIEHLAAFSQRFGLEAADDAVEAVASALQRGFRASSNVIGRLAGGVLAVAVADCDEDEFAARVERCLADLEFDPRLVRDAVAADAVRLDACVSVVDAGESVQAALDGALRSSHAGRRVRVSRTEKRRRGEHPSVFVVEDDDNLRGMLEYALTNEGYSVRAYGDGLDALSALRKAEVDSERPLLLLDVDLPGLDGLTLLERLEQERPGVFRTIILTAHGAEREQERGFRANAVDYLVKPVRIPLLLTRITRFMDREQTL